MINLLYHSHTAVPAHLEELVGLGVLERDEQVLLALDGVLQDARGQRLSGPTLHDYCLLTTLRVLLWARDYGRHNCYAFPIAELVQVEGAGTDPLHAYLRLGFSAPGEEDQLFTLALLPQRDLPAALTLLRLAGESARALAEQGVSDPYEVGDEVATLLAEQIYGSVDAPAQNNPYRWPDAPAPAGGTPGEMGLQPDPSTLPPEQIYRAGRLARSAWDTMRRALRENDLGLDFGGGGLRDLAETVRAINELLTTVTSNPTARELAMTFLNSRSGRARGPAPEEEDVADVEQSDERGAPPPRRTSAEASSQNEYREIPLRRRGEAQQPESPPRPRAASPDRSEIPLRRRQAAAAAGSGDADKAAYQEGPQGCSSEGRTS